MDAKTAQHGDQARVVYGRRASMGRWAPGSLRGMCMFFLGDFWGLGVGIWKEGWGLSVAINVNGAPVLTAPPRVIPAAGFPK